MDASQLESAIDLVVLQSARNLSLWLGILFALFIITDSLLFDGRTGRLLALLDAVLVILLLAYWWAARTGKVAPRHARAAAGAILLVTLPYILTVLWVTGQPLQSSGLALWQVGCGIFLLSWPWLLGLLLVSDMAWLAVVSQMPPSPEWEHFGTLLLSANILAVVAHGVRLGVYRRLEALRLQDRARQHALELALAEAGQVGEMRRLNQLKTRFMNVAAHELATPMTPIMIQMHLLRRSQEGLPPEARRSIDMLERGLDRLNVLLRDILDGSRLQADRLPLTLIAMDLREVLEESVEAYEPVARAAGVQVRLESGAALPIEGDAARLTQVVTNLLSNAVKFTPSAGRVIIEAAVVGHDVRVEVRDEGAGFDPERVDQLFQPFSQLHEPDGSRRGTGLGLYICRGIVERHGGTIGASSAGPGKGARFWFTVPFATA